ncbi:MAG: ParB N-terminal domain-containing protein [Acidobacteria bacterium]|nr:ParB N-terminal domain-containing protein [Acidobacteriota bacterium]
MAKQSLFDQLQADKPTCTMRKLKMAQIIKPELPPPPDDDETWKKFCANVAENGVIAPIEVRPYKDKYAIVDGIRRYYAADFDGQTYINAVILEFGVTAKADVLSVTLNRCRSANLLSEAAVIQRLREKFAKEKDYQEDGLVAQAISRLTGLKSGEIARRERLLALNEDLQTLMRHGRMALSVAEAAAKLSPARQKAVVKTYTARQAGEPETRITHADLREERTARRQEALAGLPDNVFETPDNGNGHDDDTTSKTWRAFAMLAELGYEWREGQWQSVQPVTADVAESNRRRPKRSSQPAAT